MKSSKILAVVAMASLFAASSYAADEGEIIAKYGAITIKKVTVKQLEYIYSGPEVEVEKTVAYIDDDLKAATTITNEIEVDSVYFTREFKVGSNESRASTLMLPVEGGDASASWKTGLELYSFVRVVKESGQNSYEIHVKNETQNSGHLRANTPYIALVKGNESVRISLSTRDTDMKKFVLKPTAGNHVVRYPDKNNNDQKKAYETADYLWDFTGTYENIEFKNPKNIFGFAASAGGTTQLGEFVKAACKDGKCASVRPFRAYLKCVPKSLSKSASDEDVELPETIKVFVIDDNGNKGTTAIGTLNTRTGEFVKEDNRWFDMKGRALDHKPTAKGTYYNNKKKVIIK
jgi:hypothetical protein